MKIASLATLALSWILASEGVYASKSNLKGAVDKKIGATKEDEAYWKRIMQETEMSMPGECIVEASVTCEDADGTPCNELEAATEDCDADITYTFCVRNKSKREGDEMEITSAVISQNEEETDVLGDFADTVLAVDAEECVETASVINVCEEGEYNTVFNVEAIPLSGGDACEDSATYDFAISPPDGTPAPTPPDGTPAPTPPTETPAPTTTPLTDECEIVIDTTCADEDGNDCNDLPPPITRCDFRPTEMRFKYNGGDCDQSFNIQGELFVCADIDGGPNTQDAAYIVVTDVKGNDITYFEGTVDVGEEFLMSDNGNRVDANMNVTIYDSEGGSMLQTLVYHSSCSRNLFLKDKFGSVQLTYFVNEEQGENSCFIPVTYTFTLGNTGEVPALLESLITEITPTGTFDLTDEVNELELEAGDTFDVQIEVELDMTTRQRYTATTTISGQIPFPGPTCTGTDFYEFVAGVAVEGGDPTESPTLAPTISPQPTVDPESSACTLNAAIDCTVSVGPKGSTCSNLAEADLEEGPVSILITYIIENESIAANIDSAASDSSVFGEQEFIENPPLDFPYQAEISYTEEVVISADNINNPYTFDFTVAGTGQASGEACGDSDSLEFSVAPGGGGGGVE